MVALITFLALQPDLACDRSALANVIYWDAADNHDRLLSVLLTRTSNKLAEFAPSFIRYSKDSVWIEHSHVEIDLHSVQETIESIATKSQIREPTKNLIDQLESMLSPLTLTSSNPLISQAIDSVKSRLRSIIQSQLVPAIGLDFAPHICAIVETLGLENDACGTSCSQLMSIYSGIGDHSAIHRVFAAHEDAMAQLFGASASTSTVEAYELALSSQPYVVRSNELFVSPRKPSHSFGHEKLLLQIGQLENQSRIGDVVQLLGEIGSGKTHLLSTYYHNHPDRDNILFIDFNHLELDHEFTSESLYKSTIVIVDNVEPHQTRLLHSLLNFTKCQFALVGSGSSLPIPSLTTIQIDPLEIGTSSEPGSAIQLLSCLSLDININSERLDLQQFQGLRAIAQLAMGNPKALVYAAAQIRTLGIKRTIEHMKNDLSLLATTSAVDGSQSVRSEIQSTILSLTSDELRALQILARLSDWVSTEMAIVCFPMTIEEIDSLTQKRAVICEDHCIKISSGFKEVLQSSSISLGIPRDWTQFCEATQIWVRRKVENVSENLDISKSISSLEGVCEWLLVNSESTDALRFFNHLSTWFPSCIFSIGLVQKADSLTISTSNLDPTFWGECIAAIGKGYFYSGRHDSFLKVMRWAVSSARFQILPGHLRCQLLSQTGVAFRCFDEFEDARHHFLRALDSSDSNDDRVPIFYNLGCLSESEADIHQAYDYHLEASKCYSAQTDRRLMTRNTIAMLRLGAMIEQANDHALEIFADIFDEDSVREDLTTTSVLLCDIGEYKWTSGDSRFAPHYLCIGLIAGFRRGYNKISVRTFLTTVGTLAHVCRTHGLTKLAERFDVLVSVMIRDEALNEFSSVTDHSTICCVLLNSCLASISEFITLGTPVPAELRHMLALCDEIGSENRPPESTVVFMESLKAKVGAYQKTAIVEQIKGLSPN